MCRQKRMCFLKKKNVSPKNLAYNVLRVDVAPAVRKVS